VRIAAAARGACIVEKHLTLARADGGPDAGFSLEPHEMKQVVDGCELAWHALGDGSAKRPKAEDGNRKFRRSLYAVDDIAEGQPLTRANVRSIRPGYGLPPRELPSVLGKHAKVSLARGTPLAWELIAGRPPRKSAPSRFAPQSATTASACGSGTSRPTSAPGR